MASYIPPPAAYGCLSMAHRAERILYPLHAYLKRYDVIAFRQALRGGAEPLIQDECGRSVLDLAIEQLEELIEVSLCSTLPLDQAYTDGLRSRARGPFRQREYCETYRHLYFRPNRLRSRPEGKLITPDTKVSAISMDGQSRRGFGHGQQLVHELQVPIPDDFEDHSIVYQSHALGIVVDLLSRGVPGAARRTIDELKLKMKAMVDVLKDLSRDPRLVEGTRKFIGDRGGGTQMSAGKQSGILIPSYSHPFLYVGILEGILITHDEGGNNGKSVANSEAVARKVTKQKLLGYEFIGLIKVALDSWASLISVFGPSSFVVSSDEAELLLHAAFVTKSISLFDHLCVSIDVSLEGSLSKFDWREVTESLINREDQKPYLQALVKLRARRESVRNANGGGRVSPRQLTPEVISQIQRGFGENAAKFAEQQVTGWGYLT